MLDYSIDYLVGKANVFDKYYLLSQTDKDKIVSLINELYGLSKKEKEN